VLKIYEYNVDNRIFNNMRQTMNAQLHQYNDLMKLQKFRDLFYSTFKGNPNANEIFNLLLEVIKNENDE